MAEAYNNIHPELGLDETLHILSLPLDQLEASSDYYMAASHLINFPGERAEDALLRLVLNTSSQQPIRLARRKAVEVLARLKCVRAMAAIGGCLESDDPYLIENAAWSLQQLNCQESEVLQKMCMLLEDPNQTRRVLIKSLAALGYHPASETIETLKDEDVPSIRSAVISAQLLLDGDQSRLSDLADYLVLPNQMDRQSAIQDVIDCGAARLLPDVLTSPVSPVFRLKALQALGAAAERIVDLDFDLLQNLDHLFLDSSDRLRLVHHYDEPPQDQFLIQEFFGTDFSRCYLALQTLMLRSAKDLWPILHRRWTDDAHNDYGAHYFFVLLLAGRADWPSDAIPEIRILLQDAMVNSRPQFMKSRPAAVLSLRQPWMHELRASLFEILKTSDPIRWDCRYAALMVLELDPELLQANRSAVENAVHDESELVRNRARRCLRSFQQQA